MAGIQQIALDSIVPRPKIYIGSDQVLPGPFLVGSPRLPILFPNVVPHYIVKIAVGFGSPGESGRRGAGCRHIVLDLVEQSFYRSDISFDALLGCASEYILNMYEKCRLTLIVRRLFVAADWLLSCFGLDTKELYQPSSYIVVVKRCCQLSIYVSAGNMDIVIVVGVLYLCLYTVRLVANRNDCEGRGKRETLRLFDDAYDRDIYYVQVKCQILYSYNDTS